MSMFRDESLEIPFLFQGPIRFPSQAWSATGWRFQPQILAFSCPIHEFIGLLALKSGQLFLPVFSGKIHLLPRQNHGGKGVIRSKVILAVVVCRNLESCERILLKTKMLVCLSLLPIKASHKRNGGRLGLILG